MDQQNLATLRRPLACIIPERIREMAQTGDRTQYRAEILHMNDCAKCRSALQEAETSHKRGRPGYVG